MPRKKAVRKSRVPKTRGNATMTESAFWSMIRSALRQKSRWWKPVAICKDKSRRKHQGSDKRRKFDYQCNHCKNWFAEKEISVDHIVPAGSLRNANDLPGFVERLFCEADGLQVLCNVCHDKKTKLQLSKTDQNDDLFN